MIRCSLSIQIIEKNNFIMKNVAKNNLLKENYKLFITFIKQEKKKNYL